MIDPNDAPDGYVAKESTLGCIGCALYINGHKTCLKPTGCFAAQRNDGHSVIFVKKQESKSMAVISTSKFWVVYGPETGLARIKHKTKEGAIEEAKHLSMKYPKVVFNVLEAIECYHTSVPEPKRYEMK